MHKYWLKVVWLDYEVQSTPEAQIGFRNQNLVSQAILIC